MCKASKGKGMIYNPVKMCKDSKGKGMIYNPVKMWIAESYTFTDET